MRKLSRLQKLLLVIILLLLTGLISIMSFTPSSSNDVSVSSRLRLGDICTTTAQCRNNLECVKPVGARDSQCAFKVKTACLNTTCVGKTPDTLTVASGSRCFSQELTPTCYQCYNGVHFASESDLCLRREEQKCIIYPKTNNPAKLNSNCESTLTCLRTGTTALGRRCTSKGPGSLCTTVEPCNEGKCIMVNRKDNIRRCYNGKIGSACNPSNLCEPGLFCDATSSLCKTSGEINQFCNSQNVCKPGLMCDSASSLCKTSGEINQFCNSENACKPGLMCDSASSQCKTSGEVNQFCNSENSCRPGLICTDENICEDLNTPIEVRVKVLNYFNGHFDNPKITSDNVNLLIKNIEENLEESAQYKKHANPSISIPSALKISIVDNQFITKTPPQKGVNCEQYLPLIESGNWRAIDWQTTNCWGSGTADYIKILDENNVCTDINNNVYDEVWILGFGSAGFWEAVMTGDGAFHTNGPVMSGTQVICNRPVHIMGLNYEVLKNGVFLEYATGVALHSFGHRFEGTMKTFLSSEFLKFNRNQERYSWAYGVQHTIDPSVNPSCGNIHWPPNAQSHYDYTNVGSINSDCIDWNVNGTGQKTPINCTLWGCTQLGFMKWWMQNIPGMNNNLTKIDGSPMPNWWQAYLFNSPKDPNSSLRNFQSLPEFAGREYTIMDMRE